MAQMRICFIGDSYVSGACDSQCLGWAGRISTKARARGHDVSLYNLGIRGETSVQIARRWRAEAEIRQTPSQEGRLVFEFGVNDVREVNGKRQLELSQSLAAAREILSAACAWRTTLMIGPPPAPDSARNGDIEELSAAIAQLCAGLEVPYFDSYGELSCTPAFVADVAAMDGAHPSATGYAQWADAIESWPPWRVWLP